jgi:hypothetical protein
VHWLTNDTRDERFIDNIFAELCVRLQRAGIPVKRAPQRNRDELGETTVNKTCRKHLLEQEKSTT